MTNNVNNLSNIFEPIIEDTIEALQAKYTNAILIDNCSQIGVSRQNYICYTINTTGGSYFVLHNPNLQRKGVYTIAYYNSQLFQLTSLTTGERYTDYNVVNWSEYFETT